VAKSKEIAKLLRQQSDPKIAEKCLRFFKTGEGEYGHGDLFLGLRTPFLRQVAKDHHTLSLPSTLSLLKSKFHEERLCALFILVLKYQKATSGTQKTEVYKGYVKSFPYVNNWDLVDSSSPYIVGRHLIDRDRRILYTWARAPHLWTRRIAMLSNWWFIRKGDLSEVFKLSKILLDDEEDLMHKAVGWMLREAGKKDVSVLTEFLESNFKNIPRTTLRYAIEKYPEVQRKRMLKGVFS